MGIRGRLTRAPICVQKCRDSARQVPQITEPVVKTNTGE